MAIPVSTVQKNKATQIRVAPTTYKGVTYMDVREYAIWGDNKDYQPTKSGLTVPPEMVDALIEALQKQKQTLAKTVAAVEGKREAYVIAKTPEDVLLLKKAHIYDDEDHATGKAPPDGFKLYKVLIEDGVVVKKRLLYRRKNNRWEAVEVAGQKTGATPVALAKKRH